MLGTNARKWIWVNIWKLHTCLEGGLSSSIFALKGNRSIFSVHSQLTGSQLWGGVGWEMNVKA